MSLYSQPKNYLHTRIFVCISQNEINPTENFWLFYRYALMENHATDHHVEITYQIGKMGTATQNI